MKVTMADVARVSGVSKATVSYILNGKKTACGISEQTVVRVMDAVRRLDYRINPAAVELSEKKTEVCRILLFSPWLYSQFSDFMLQVSATIGLISTERKLALTYEMYRVNSIKDTLRPARAAKFDALLVMGTELADDAFLHKNHIKFPNLVLLNRTIESIPSASGSDREAAREIARRIAGTDYYDRHIIFTHADGSSLGRARVEGLREGLSALPPKKIKIIQREEFSDGEILRECMTGRPCVYEMRHIEAAELVSRLTAAGRRVPNDAGVVTCDRHSVLDRVLPVPLTTIDTRIDEMTRAAIDLCFALKNHQEIKNRIVRAEILFRKSTVGGSEKGEEK